MEGLERAADDVVRCPPFGYDATRKPSLAAVVWGQVANVGASTKGIKDSVLPVPICTNWTNPARVK